MVKTSSFKLSWVVLLVAAAVVPRLPVVPAGFAADDPWLVEHAEASTHPGETLFEAWPPGVYRPLVMLAFELMEARFGSWAPGYHMASIALHLIVVLLVYLLCIRLAGAGRPAFIAALGFALLPALNEAIAWAASIGDVLATGFLVAAMLLALQANERRNFPGLVLWLAAVAAVVAACAAKETAVIAALLVPAAVWIFGRSRPTWGWTAAVPAVVIAYMSWYVTRMPRQGLISMVAGSPWRCLKTTVQNIVIALVPVGRNTVGDMLWSRPQVAAVLTVLGGLAFTLLIVLAARSGRRIALFGLVWTVAAFLPVCRLAWAERYVYLPAVGMALVALSVLERVRDRKHVGARAAVAVVLVVFALGSLVAAVQWTVQVGR